MTKNISLKQQVALAAKACDAKKAHDISILEMESGAFTDYMVLASAANAKQAQAIIDEVEVELEKAGIRANSKEGFSTAEWILLDYVDFVVHIFLEQKRVYYGLDRLWKSAKAYTPATFAAGKPAKKAGKKQLKKPAKKAAARRVPMKSVKKKSLKKPATKKASSSRTDKKKSVTKKKSKKK
jgi:ribosome-associated protein